MSLITHYVGIAVLLLIVYFGAAGLIDKLHPTSPQPAVSQKQIAQAVVDALKNPALGKKIQLSYAQAPVAGVLNKFGAGKLAAPLAAGLTQPPPKVEVVTVGTAAKNTIEAQVAPTDTQTEAAVKKALADPTTVIHTKVDTTVHISYEDKKFSPIFSLYTARGDQGAGLTLRHTPALDLDALLTTAPAVGVGVEHIFKGTSAGIGIGETYNFSAHRAQTEVYAAIHF